MTNKESIVAVVDTLVSLSAGIAIAYLCFAIVRAFWWGYVHINGQKATWRKEPLGFGLVVLAFFGVSYFLWPLFFRLIEPWFK